MSEITDEELNHLQEMAYSELLKRNYEKSRELFEVVFDHAPIEASVYLGYIHSEKNTSEYNIGKALGYLISAAEADNVQAMTYLGNLLDDIGRQSESIDWLLRASERGSSDASRLAAWMLRKQDRIAESEKLINRAASQGDASAVQIIAIRKIKGRNGLAEVGPGLIMLVKNILPLIRYIKGRV